MKNFKETIKCPICKTAEYKIIRKANSKRLNQKQLKKIYLSSSDNKLTDQLSKCVNCGLVYLNPRVNSKLILEGYKKNSDKVFTQQNNNRIKTFIYNFTKILKTLKKDKNKNLKILDVGTGSGSFLLALKKLGYNGVGIEPNKWLVKFIRKKYNLNIYAKTLENFKVKQKYDIICFWDVFEHVTDLNETLKIARKLLKNKGHIVINVPDHGSLARKIFRNNWPFYLNVHLYYFEKSNLKRLFQNHKFIFKKKLIHFQNLPLRYLIKRASNYLGILKKMINIIPSKYDFGVWYNMGQNIYLMQKK